jgi:hypothetical protein
MSAAAAKKNPAVTEPPNNKTAPSSSLRNQRYASRIQKVSSNPYLYKDDVCDILRVKKTRVRN